MVLVSPCDQITSGYSDVELMLSFGVTEEEQEERLGCLGHVVVTWCFVAMTASYAFHMSMSTTKSKKYRKGTDVLPEGILEAG